MRWGMLLLVVGGIAQAQTEQSKPGLAVFDMRGIDTRPTEAAAATNAVVKGLRELDAFDVLSSDDLRQLLSIERQKQMLGVESDANASASVQALGVKNFVVGSVTRTSGGLSAELRLLDPATNKVVSQRTLAAQPSLDKLASGLVVAAQELVGPLLQAEQGQLLVRTREEGAEVLVDDISRGSTPLPAPIVIPRGRHRLTIKKDGFIARVTVASVAKDQLTLEDVTLVPSADYMAAYNAKNKRLRIGGYVAAGLAVASFVTAVLLDRVGAEPKYQNDFKPRQEVLEAVSIGNANPTAFTTQIQQECLANQETCRTEARSAASTIQGLQIATWVMVGVGAAAVVAAAYCFLAGEDPNRYAQLVASILPEGGGTVGLVGHW